MEAMINAVSAVFTAAIGWVATVGTTIAGNEILLLFCVAVPLCGLGVGMFKRLLSSRG